MTRVQEALDHLHVLMLNMWPLRQLRELRQISICGAQCEEHRTRIPDGRPKIVECWSYKEGDLDEVARRIGRALLIHGAAELRARRTLTGGTAWLVVEDGGEEWYVPLHSDMFMAMRAILAIDTRGVAAIYVYLRPEEKEEGT